jgi:hypothetical protein
VLTMHTRHEMNFRDAGQPHTGPHRTNFTPTSKHEQGLANLSRLSPVFRRQSSTEQKRKLVKSRGPRGFFWLRLEDTPYRKITKIDR